MAKDGVVSGGGRVCQYLVGGFVLALTVFGVVSGAPWGVVEPVGVVAHVGGPGLVFIGADGGVVLLGIVSVGVGLKVAVEVGLEVLVVGVHCPEVGAVVAGAAAAEVRCRRGRSGYCGTVVFGSVEVWRELD